METRKITVILESGNGTRTIETGAETLGELKQSFAANGIDYHGKIIREGLSRTEFIDDTSLLPKDVPFRGQTTNNLVFTLTTENKRIKSGGMTRAEVYGAVKKAGLQDAIKCEFGKNFTQVGTSELEAFIITHYGTVVATPAATPRSEEAQAVEAHDCECPNTKRALLRLIDLLEKSVDELRDMVGGASSCSCDSCAFSTESPWSAEDLAAITAGIR